MIRIVVLGASTNLLELVDLIDDINAQAPTYEIVGALDDDAKRHGTMVAGVKVLGPLALATEMADVSFIMAIGSNKTRLIRLEILRRLGIPDDRFVTVIHPDAKIYKAATLGHGCIVHKGVVIAGDARIGAFVTITFNAIIAAAVRIDRGTLVASASFIGVGTRIGSGVFIGAASAVGEGLKIGPGAMVGMASAVYRDVAPGMFVLGNPARKVYPVKVPAELIAEWNELNAG